MKIELLYKYGKLDKLTIIENTTQKDIPEITQTALFNYCRFNVSWYNELEEVRLICSVNVNHTTFGKLSNNIVNKLLTENKKTMDSAIHIIPLNSDVKDDKFNYLLYNMRDCQEGIMLVNDLDGRVIDITNPNLTEYKITDIIFDGTMYNYYDVIVFSDTKEFKINTSDCIDMKLKINDIIYFNNINGKITLKTYKSNKDKFEITTKCLCGNDLIIINKKIICNSIDLCTYELTNIIEVYLSLINDDSLNELFYNNYINVPKEFIDYLSSLDKINFYNLSNDIKNKIFFTEDKLIQFPEDYNIKMCKNLLPYSYNIIKNKTNYITILENLYNDK